MLSQLKQPTTHTASSDTFQVSEVRPHGKTHSRGAKDYFLVSFHRSAKESCGCTHEISTFVGKETNTQTCYFTGHPTINAGGVVRVSYFTGHSTIQHWVGGKGYLAPLSSWSIFFFLFKKWAHIINIIVKPTLFT